jgi:hypothetical protein
MHDPHTHTFDGAKLASLESFAHPHDADQPASYGLRHNALSPLETLASPSRRSRPAPRRS